MMNKNKSWLSGFLGGIAVSILLGSTVFYVKYGTLPMIGDSVALGSFAQKTAKIERLVEKNYLEEVDSGTLAEGMYAGMMASLEDPYSGYFSEEMYKRFQESSEGRYTGIGLSMMQDTETKEVTVYECFPDTPAEKAGIQAGDVIYKVNGQLAAELGVTGLSNQIKDGGTEEIQMVLIRDGKEIEVTIVPEIVEVPVITSRMLEDSVGYLQIEEFTEGTPEQFKKEYESLQEQGMKGMIIDLRNNPGGLLTSVCDTLRQILPEGMIVYTEDRYGNRNEHTCEGETPIEIPLVVLVNEESASAAEIFAGAVKDHGVGTLVGTTTFGKGIVQKTYALGDGSAVKMTVSKYYTPNGTNIHGTGIEPNEEVAWPEGEEALTSPRQVNDLPLDEWLAADNQMEKSLAVLQTLVADGEK
ncbi:MAG: S41 family peptidase [Clostridiales bacterium]|nr:S41 family peptidase [Clostridiales bacterium]